MRRIKVCACLLALLIFAAALGGCTATNACEFVGCAYALPHAAGTWGSCEQELI